MKKRLIVLLIAAQLAAITACGSQSGTQDTGSSTEKPASETTSYYDTLDIPDFSGQTFTILARTDLLDEVYSEMETGEIVNDAVYARNRNVSERLGIDINIINQPGDWANKDQFISYVSSSILAGDDAFQVVAGYMNYMPVTILDGLYLDINTLPYIDFGNEWWTNGFNDNATINGRLFMAMGDMCSSMLRYAFCGYANMKLLTDYGYSADELYQAVRDGKWTFDMMTGMAKNVSSDLNGDGVMDENDLHGVGMHNMPIRALTNAFGIDYTTRGPDGLPQIAMYGERLIGGFEKVLSAYKSDYWYDTNDSNKFKADKTLFYFDVLGATTALRDMQSNFSVVPMPKLDEQQNGYRTETVDTTSILMVPVSITNHELTGIALECLNYESWRLITPAYFETAMQSKYARDEESKEMMEIIRDSIYFDFGYVFAGAIGGGINGIMEAALKEESIASVWDSKKGVMNAGLEKLIDFFNE